MSTEPYLPLRPAQRQQLRLRGIDTQLWRWGRPDGRLLVLLHGWMDCAATFQFLIDAAPDALLDYQLVAIDWRGFGQSGWAAESYYFPDYLADLDALLGQLAPEGEPVALLGHSMGGMVAGLYAGIRPERVSQLISLEGFGLPATHPEQAPGRYRRWLDELQSTTELKPLADFAALAARLSKHNPRLAANKARWLAEQLGRQADGQIVYRADPRHKWVNPVLYRLEEVQACWRQISAATLWLAGNEAKLLGWLGEDAAQFAARKACIAGLQYEVLDDCGHNLHHDAPARVAERLIRFLAQS